MQKQVILEVESGKHKRDNQMLQKLEKKLGVWLTGDSERIGTSKTKEKDGGKDEVQKSKEGGKRRKG